MRRNILRDIEGRLLETRTFYRQKVDRKSLLERVCKDVKIEPELIPSNKETAGNVAEKVRLDISAREIWGIQVKTFFDIRITHPNTTLTMTKSLEAIYESNEIRRNASVVTEYYM